MMNTLENVMYWNGEVQKKNQLLATVGIWIDGKVYWMKNSHEKLFVEEGISISIKQEHVHSKVKHYDIYVTNHEARDKNIKLLMMHRHENSAKDHFSFVSPAENVIYHLADHMVYLVNGQHNGKSISQWTVQPQWNFYSNNYWDCTEKGILKYQPMAKGMAVSIYLLPIQLGARETCISNSWIISSHHKAELMELNACLTKTH